MRKELGPDLMFVVLHMTKENQDKRLKGRHGDNEDAESLNDYPTNLHKIYVPATEDEPNSLDLQVTLEMTPEDVIAKILDSLKKSKILLISHSFMKQDTINFDLKLPNKLYS